MCSLPDAYEIRLLRICKEDICGLQNTEITPFVSFVNLFLTALYIFG
jgi:hypothetical protein